jgi:hypothetical protein
MNSRQAKAIPLVSFLAALSHAPTREFGADVWYRSPFRPNERTPSFKVDVEKNVWFDHALGKGGTIIDFMQVLYATEDVSRALALIEDVIGGVESSVTFATPPPRLVTSDRFTPEIERVGEIMDAGLTRYLSARAIPVELARRYLSEVHYRLGADRYWALGFPNDAGGFEVRNPYFKGSIGKKAIRFIESAGRTDAAVFEGVFDFLSALAWAKTEHPAGNVLVLNSVAFLERGIARLQGAGVTTVQSYLDHDQAGRLALAGLQRAAQEGQGTGGSAMTVDDQSGVYAGYKDFNEFLMATRLPSERLP